MKSKSYCIPLTFCDIDILGNDLLEELTFLGMNILIVHIMVLIQSCNYVCIVCVYPCKCVQIMLFLIYCLSLVIVGVADHILGGNTEEILEISCQL